MIDHKKSNDKYRLSYDKQINDYLTNSYINLETKDFGKISIPLIIYLYGLEGFCLADDIFQFTYSKEWIGMIRKQIKYPSNILSKARSVHKVKNEKDVDKEWKNGRVNTALTFCNFLRASSWGNVIEIPNVAMRMGQMRGMSPVNKKEFQDFMGDKI